jgi:DNA-binding NtrC family response regulator
MNELALFRHGTELMRIKVEGSRIVIGRSDRCDVVIPDERVSRRQAAVTLVEGKAYVEDLSGAGTTVSGTLVTTRTELPDGSDISLGQWRAVWRSGGSRAAEGNGPPIDAVTFKAHVETTRFAPDAPPAGPGPNARARIRVRHDGGETLHGLADKPVTLGKDLGNDVVLEGDPFVSGKHLRIVPNVPSEGLFHLEDMHSTNGTFLGAGRIYEADVPFFTCLRLAGTEVVIERIDEAQTEQAPSGIVGSHASVRQLLDVIDRIAPAAASVAILGESGTGKELVARAIHSRSARADRPFIPINCAAISKTLIESELFGYEKGAFTGAVAPRKGAFEEADGGTLFLDEIGELSPELQATLLRALESGEVKRVGATRPTHVDVRVLVATNVDLFNAVQEKRFREDLYYRVCVLPVQVPPLRARLSDLSVLAEHFLKAFSPHGPSVRLTSQALARLKGHRWPGNVRELRNVIHRGLLLRKGAHVDAGDILFDEAPLATRRSTATLKPGMNLEQTLQVLEREIIEDCLARNDGVREHAARELGLGRSALFKRLRVWGAEAREDA